MSDKGNELRNLHNGKPLNAANENEVQGGDFMPTINEPTILRDSVPQNTQQQFIPEGPSGNGPISFDDDDDDDFEDTRNKSAIKESQEPEQTDAEKEENSMALANGTCDLIIFGCKQTEELIKISDKKLDKLEKDGFIDKRMPIRLQNTEIPVKEFVERFNQTVDGQLIPKESFKEDVAPLLAKQFKKWGIGLSSGQQAGIGILKYGYTFCTNLFPLLGQRKEAINTLKETGEWYKQYVMAKQQEQIQAQPVVQQTIPQQQTVQQTPVVQMPQQNNTSVAAAPSVMVVPDSDGLPQKGNGVKRGRPDKKV